MDALSHAVGKIAGREMESSIPQMGPSAVKFRRVQIGESISNRVPLREREPNAKDQYGDAGSDCHPRYH